ncbi:MAG: OsmC family peroxiredoxin [Ferruginibacter sp.]|nr:OsmC family peroxiredoxin [Ferruginibacter sp.]
MKGKTYKHFLFEVQLNSKENKIGTLSVDDIASEIEIAIPKKFGGIGLHWSAEHLFLSAISSSYFTTYLAYAKKIKLNITKYESNIIGQIEVVKRRYMFTLINLYPTIYIANESLKENAILAIKKTNKFCLISNSINAEIYYHPKILIENGNTF